MNSLVKLLYLKGLFGWLFARDTPGDTRCLLLGHFPRLCPAHQDASAPQKKRRRFNPTERHSNPVWVIDRRYHERDAAMSKCSGAAFLPKEANNKRSLCSEYTSCAWGELRRPLLHPHAEDENTQHGGGCHALHDTKNKKAEVGRRDFWIRPTHIPRDVHTELQWRGQCARWWSVDCCRSS